MARIIAVVGTKGGSGKTTTAHALGHGFGSLPQPISCIVITTDEGTPIPNRENRRYIPADGTTGEGLKRVLSPVMDRDDVFVIIDGAARRTGADEAVTRIADLVIIPLDPSPQALEWALRDLERFPMALALPTRWPSHRDTRARADRLLTQLPAKRWLPPFPAIPKLADILDDGLYPTHASALSSSCKALAVEILHRLQVRRPGRDKRPVVAS